MEVRAVLEALRVLDGPLTVVERFGLCGQLLPTTMVCRLEEAGWRNSQGQPVANQDLWEPLLALALDPERTVKFRKVKGHSGDPMNDLVDELAVEAATTGNGRSGQGSGRLTLP